MKPVCLLVADDHAMVRKGLRSVLEKHAGWKVVAEAANGREAVMKAKATKPDVAILDITMPSLNGLEATRQIIACSPQTLVLILSIHESNSVIEEILKAGARGY